MFKFFERLLKPTDIPEQPVPPPGLVAFFWFYARQARGLFAALFVVGFMVALLDTTIPIFIGRVVTLVTSNEPATLFAEHWSLLVAMAAILVIVRPAAITTQNLLQNQAIAANVTNRIRWQNHWHVVRQSWSFFQDDFAGRIANRVMQTGPAIRETVVQLITGVWYILVYGTSALILLASADPWLAIASAVERTRDGLPPWHPEQRIAPEAALAASTRSRIAIGEPADIVIVENDPLLSSVDELRTMPVFATFLAGKPTFRSHSPFHSDSDSLPSELL